VMAVGRESRQATCILCFRGELDDQTSSREGSTIGGYSLSYLGINVGEGTMINRLASSTFEAAVETRLTGSVSMIGSYKMPRISRFPASVTSAL